MTDSDVTELGGYQNHFTETVGLFLFAVYNWITVIVILNMLIAMMSKSFEVVEGDQDVEWKFARTNLYMDYIKDFASLPPPFNIIPSPKSVVRILCRFCCLRKKHSEIRASRCTNEQHRSRVRPKGMYEVGLTVRIEHMYYY